MPKLSKTRITDKTVKSAKPRTSVYDIRDATLRGFLLRVQPSGSKSFYAEWGRGKKSRIGDAELITVSRAREIAAERISDAKRGEIPQPQIRNSMPTLEGFVTGQYKEWALTHQKSGAANVQRLIGAFPTLMTTRLDQLTSFAVESWRVQRKKIGRAPSTINRDVTMLKAALNKAVDWGTIQKNPVEKLKPLRGADNARVRYLSQEEELRLLRAIGKRQGRILREESSSANGHVRLFRRGRFVDHLEPMILLAMNTGLRFTEISRLKWSDVSLTDAPRLTVQAAYSKSGKSRHVPLNETATQALRDWRRSVLDAEGFVFSTTNGNRIKSVKKGWQALLDKAQIRDFRWHDLRHHFASKLVMAGVDLNTVRELLGHNSIDMTLRYAHLAPEHKAAAVAKLDVVVAEPSS